MEQPLILICRSNSSYRSAVENVLPRSKFTKYETMRKSGLLDSALFHRGKNSQSRLTPKTQQGTWFLTSFVSSDLDVNTKRVLSGMLPHLCVLTASPLTQLLMFRDLVKGGSSAQFSPCFSPFKVDCVEKKRAVNESFDVGCL